METAIDNWPELDGYAVAHGLGWLQDMPLSRFRNFVWYMLTRNEDQNGILKLRARLWQQPKGEVVTDARSPWSPRNEQGSLAAFKSGMGG